MTDDNDLTEQNGTESSNIVRRSVLKTVAGGSFIAAGIGAFAGVASAHEVTEVEFCGCTRVIVRGVLLLGSDDCPSDSLDDEDGGYRAVLYCDGEIEREPLRGSCTEQRYDLLEDGRSLENCQIIAVEGETYSSEDGTQTFTICNEHCDFECADAGLGDEGALENADIVCQDPSDVTSGDGSQETSLDEVVEIDVTCDPSCIETPGDEGCTPGFWRNPAKRRGVWTDDDEYGPSDLVKDVFELAVTGTSGSGPNGSGPGNGGGPPSSGPGNGGGPPSSGPGNGGGNGRGNERDWDELTLCEALEGGGGPGIEGAQTILIRAAVAALLNAQNDDVDYPRTTDEIIESVDAALATEDRDEILSLADELDADNNLGCPL